MARPNWEYIRVDVLLRYHPKLDGATYPMKWTLIELWSHCGQFLTDGFVRTEVWRHTGTAKARQELVDRDLAHKVRGGYQMHDYLEHQRSRAEVEELRAKRSAAGRKGGLAKPNAKQVLKQVPEHLLKQNGSKTEAEAEAEFYGPLARSPVTLQSQSKSFSEFTDPKPVSTQWRAGAHAREEQD